MTIEIHLGNSIPPALKAHVGAWCDSELPNKVSLEERDMLRSFDPATIAGVTSAIVSVITLLVQLWPNRNWDIDRLRSTTADALIKHGIVDFEITDVSNFTALSDSNTSLNCLVNILNKRTGSEHIVLISRNGDTFVLELESN